MHNIKPIVIPLLCNSFIITHEIYEKVSSIKNFWLYDILCIKTMTTVPHNVQSSANNLFKVHSHIYKFDMALLMCLLCDVLTNDSVCDVQKETFPT